MAVNGKRETGQKRSRDHRSEVWVLGAHEPNQIRGLQVQAETSPGGDDCGRISFSGLGVSQLLSSLPPRLRSAATHHPRTFPSNNASLETLVSSYLPDSRPLHSMGQKIATSFENSVYACLCARFAPSPMTVAGSELFTIYTLVWLLA